jgi:serine/threonine protein kinase/tetratricopeptide (TPR) repeat protein
MDNTLCLSTKALFGEAFDRSGPERAAYLDDACAGRSELRGRVEALLADAEADDPFLREATLESRVPESALADDSIGARIGPYKLLGLIGEGGFGSVYLAEQEEPVRRRVALKIIKLGMDTRSVIARFEQERQALAVMHHPNIAKVLDAGATRAGRPYFVMELVRGEPITAYCDQKRLAIPERLALFAQVCQAVQHAHSKGVIHRDIKPSNVLVTTEDAGPLARVIDFGVAKVMSHRFTEKTVFTGVRQLVGTLEYMSPEQAEGSLDIDTRTDIYALGVLLYELLTGSTPLEAARLHAAPYAELQRIIREDDPPRPSTRLSHAADALPDVALRRRAEPRTLARTLRGELDWIVMRALDKDRARRYETASAFAADIHRYLAREVVAAAPPRLGYRLRKFVRRHRVSVVGAGVVGATLVLGVIGTSVGLMQALDQRDKAIAAESLANDRLAEAEEARAEANDARAQAEKSNRIASAVTQFFTQDVLDLKPLPGGVPEPTVRQLLDAVPEKIDRYFTSDPAVEGIIRERVGQLYRRLGEIDRCRQYLEDAVPLLEKGLGADHKQTLSAVHRLGELNIDIGRFDRAAELFDRAYQGRLRAHGLEYHLTMGSLGRRGYARVCAGSSEAGFRDLTAALAHFQSRDGTDSRNVSVVSLNLSDAYLHAGRAEEARALAARVLDTILAKGGDIAGLEWGARMNLGIACRMLGRLDEAMAQFDKVLEVTQRIYPPTHPEFIEIRLEYGRALAALQRNEAARAELETAYALAERAFGPQGLACREVAASLAALAAQTGDAESAARWRVRSQ